MKYVLSFFLTISFFISFGQNDISSFVPIDYEVLDEVIGDLNNDGIEDKIFVLNQIDEEVKYQKYGKKTNRILQILIGSSNEKYKLAFQSSNLIYPFGSEANFKDCFTQVVIKKGFFSLEHYGGTITRWKRITTFKYSSSKENWLLFKDGYLTFSFDRPNKIVSERIKTQKDFGVVNINDFNITNKF